MSRLRIVLIVALAGTVAAGCGKSSDEAASGDKAGPGAAKPVSLESMHPSPGLWEMAVKVAGMPAGVTPVSKVCYDESVAKEAGVSGPQASEYAKCDQKIDRISGGFEVTATCPGPDGKPTTVTSRVTGDLSKAYTVRITQPAGGPGAPGGSVEIDAKRLGDCPADFKPGDVETMGVKVNMANAAKRGAAGQ